MIQLWEFVETTLSRETEYNLSLGRGSLNEIRIIHVKS